MKDWEVFKAISKTCCETGSCKECIYHSICNGCSVIYEWHNFLTQETFDELKKIAEEEFNKVDWTKVEVDTKILVRDIDTAPWVRRHFAKVEDGIVYAWEGGNTSFTTVAVTSWEYTKLYMGGESDGK